MKLVLLSVLFFAGLAMASATSTGASLGRAREYLLEDGPEQMEKDEEAAEQNLMDGEMAKIPADKKKEGEAKAKAVRQKLDKLPEAEKAGIFKKALQSLESFETVHSALCKFANAPKECADAAAKMQAKLDRTRCFADCIKEKKVPHTSGLKTEVELYIKAKEASDQKQAEAKEKREERSKSAKGMFGSLKAGITNAVSKGGSIVTGAVDMGMSGVRVAAIGRKGAVFAVKAMLFDRKYPCMAFCKKKTGGKNPEACCKAEGEAKGCDAIKPCAAPSKFRAVSQHVSRGWAWLSKSAALHKKSMARRVHGALREDPDGNGVMETIGMGFLVALVAMVCMATGVVPCLLAYVMIHS